VPVVFLIVKGVRVGSGGEIEGFWEMELWEIIMKMEMRIRRIKIMKKYLK
jgi:hypothetical protein